MNALHEQLTLSLFHVERASYRRLELRDNTHPHWAFSYVVSGEVETISRGHRNRARAGDIMVHPPHVAYSEIAGTPGTHEWLLFEAVIPPGVDMLRRHPVSPVVSLGAESGYRDIFDLLLRLWQNGAGTFTGLEAAAQLTRLLTLVLTAWERHGSVPRPIALQTEEDRFTPVLHFMADRLSEKITRSDLAHLACLHPVYFDRKFRQAFGLPPLALLRQMRLDRARQLLESGDATLETIAHACGFTSASHLGRAFLERFGQTPGAWRQGLTDAKNRYRDAL